MKQRVCIVTGGTGGIGYHISVDFHNAGYKVIALDCKQHKPVPEGIEFIKADLKNENEILDAFRNIKARCAAAHILINNAAIAHFHKSINEITVEEFDSVMDVNLRGSFICIKEFVKLNEGEGYGRIINIASTRWHQNEAGWDAYGASKGGLVSLTNSLTVSLGDTPITVNAISPGWIQVDDYDLLTQEDHNMHPSGRVGRASDIANACRFLADENNDFINGNNLIIDGGMTKKMIY